MLGIEISSVKETCGEKKKRKQILTLMYKANSIAGYESWHYCRWFQYMTLINQNQIQIAIKWKDRNMSPKTE